MNVLQRISVICSFVVLTFVGQVKGQVVGFDVRWADVFETDRSSNVLYAFEYTGEWSLTEGGKFVEGDGWEALKLFELYGVVKGGGIIGSEGGTFETFNNQIPDNGMLDVSEEATGIFLAFQTRYGSGAGALVNKVRFFFKGGHYVDYDVNLDFRNYEGTSSYQYVSTTIPFPISENTGLTSSSHPLSSKWYRNDTIDFGWPAFPGADYYLWQVVPLGETLDVENKGTATTDLFANTDALSDGAYRIGVMAFVNNEYVDVGAMTGRIDTKVSLPRTISFGANWSPELPELTTADNESPIYYTNKTDSVRVWLKADTTAESTASGFNRAYVSVSSESSDRPVISDETTLQMPTIDLYTQNYPCGPGGIYERGSTTQRANEYWELSGQIDSYFNPQVRFKASLFSRSGSFSNFSRSELVVYNQRPRFEMETDTYPTFLDRNYNLELSSEDGDYYSDLGGFLYDYQSKFTSGEIYVVPYVVSDDDSPSENYSCVTLVETKFYTRGVFSAMLSGLQSGRNYIHVSTRDNAGNRSDNAYWILDVDADPPLATKAVTARNYSDGDVLLSWSASSDEKSGLAKYRIYRSTRVGELGTLIDSTTALRYRDYSRDNGGTLLATLEYFYTVRPVDALGNENTSSDNVQVGSKSSRPLPDSDSVVFATGGRVSSDTEFTLSVNGLFATDGAQLTLGEPQITDGQIVLYVETQWNEDNSTTEWDFESLFEGLPEGAYDVRLIANETTLVARFDLEVVGLPTVVAESTTFETVPNPATISDEVSLTIRGQLPSADASLAQASLVSTSDSEVVIDIQTQWDDDTGNADATDFETQVSIGYLQVGTYEVAIQVNGLEVTRSSLEILEGPPPEGPISLDFDTNEGDQEQRLAKGARPDREYTLDINVADVQAINGWNIVVEYDPSMVEYVGGSFAPGSFISGLLGLEDMSKSNRVGVGGTVLGTNAQGVGSGTLGQMKFRVAEGFSGETTLRIVEISLRPVDGEQIKLEVLHTVTLSDEVDLVGDANGDGVVGFDDFFLFADAFGGADPAFDYDGSGTVDFSDFFIFADNFGKEAQAKLIAMAHELIGLPKESGLLPNYPNPFNMETTIPFQIMQEGEYLVAIYNTTGQLVRTLHSGFIPYGLHTLSWNGLDDQAQPVSSGVYLISLLGKDTRDLRKLMLLK